MKKSNYQGCAVVNYCDKYIPYTRIIEHKHFTYMHEPEIIKETVITREYPKKDGEPYYPVNDEKNNKKLLQYQETAKRIYPNWIIGGRLGSYRYMNMDQTIESAINILKD